MLISAVETVDNPPGWPGAADGPVDAPVDPLRPSCESIVHNFGALARGYAHVGHCPLADAPRLCRVASISKELRAR